MNEREAQLPTGAARAAPPPFDAAVALHRGGRLREAEQLYRAILANDADHVDALHHLGLALTQQGRFADAVPLLERAVGLKPGAVEPLTLFGIALMRVGRLESAARVYEQALALAPSNVEARNNLGAVLLSLGRSEEAAATFSAALRLRPGTAALHNNLGLALAALGRLEEAAAEHEKAVTLEPRYVDANDNLGNTLVKLGRSHEALARLYRALDLTPDAATTHNALAAALLAVKAHEEAVVHARRATEIRPDFPEAHNNLGLALTGLRRYEEATAEYHRALALKPDLAEAYNNLGNAQSGLKRLEGAIADYRRALALRPDFYEAYNNRGNALSALKRHAEAEPHFRRALEIKPDFAEAATNLALALTALHRHDEALGWYERALTLAPELPEARSGYGNQLMILGRIEEARAQVEQAIALAPHQPSFYITLASVKRFTPGDPHLAVMEALSGRADGMTDDERINLHFALGKAYADVGRHEAAFAHLQAGNALKRRQIAYDEPAALRQLEQIAATYTPEAMRRLAGCGDPSAVPVFVLGMPRSGTTLVEQVLASHPAVFGAGEIGEFEAAITAVMGRDGSPALPGGLAAMTPEQVRRIGSRYLEQVSALAPAAERITDKMLMNFRHVGLIHLALPNARIIHVQREPAATALSCFSRLFGGDLPFTYDLAELGRYYRAYQRLMAHWRAVLPTGAMLELRYEDLVADFPGQARRLVAYCGLPWDERCSAFHETRRPVTTSSATQVRQPLYREAVAAWLPYKDKLQPFFEALGERP